MPTWRIPPPSSFRARRARQMKSFEPTSDAADRAGQALREAERHAVGRARRARARPRRARRRRSRTARRRCGAARRPRGPRRRARARTPTDSGWLFAWALAFSNDDEAGDRLVDVGRVAEALRGPPSRSSVPSGCSSIGRTDAPTTTAWLAASCSTMWPWAPAMISWPRWRCAIWATRLPIAPDATNRPASLPSSSAARSSSAMTVGSSPKTSSPTSASAIARRISGVGFVTVSDRRSMMGMGPARIARNSLVSSAFVARTRGVAAQHASLSRWRSPVRIRSGPPRFDSIRRPVRPPERGVISFGRALGPVGAPYLRRADGGGACAHPFRRDRVDRVAASARPAPAGIRGSRSRATDLPEIEFVAYSTSERLSGRIRLDSARLTDMLNAHREFVLVDALAERLPDGGSMVVPEILAPAPRARARPGRRPARRPDATRSDDAPPPRPAIRPLHRRRPHPQLARRGPARRAPRPRPDGSRSPTPSILFRSGSDIVEEGSRHDRRQSRPRRVGPRGRARRPQHRPPAALTAPGGATTIRACHLRTRPATGTARGHPRHRLLDRPGRAVLHDAPRRPRRGRHQGRAARGRRDARLGAALGRRRGGRWHPDRHVLPRGQPQQAQHPARPRGARRAARSCGRCCAAATRSSRTTGLAGSRGSASPTRSLRELNPTWSTSPSAGSAPAARTPRSPATTS